MGATPRAASSGTCAGSELEWLRRDSRPPPRRPPPSRATAATHALDATAPHPRTGQVSLRWIYVHMIEETARHAGHADICAS